MLIFIEMIAVIALLFQSYALYKSKVGDVFFLRPYTSFLIMVGYIFSDKSFYKYAGIEFYILFALSILMLYLFTRKAKKFQQIEAEQEPQEAGEYQHIILPELPEYQFTEKASKLCIPQRNKTKLMKELGFTWLERFYFKYSESILFACLFVMLIGVVLSYFMIDYNFTVTSTVLYLLAGCALAAFVAAGVASLSNIIIPHAETKFPFYHDKLLIINEESESYNLLSKFKFSVTNIPREQLLRLIKLNNFSYVTNDIEVSDNEIECMNFMANHLGINSTAKYAGRIYGSDHILLVNLRTQTIQEIKIDKRLINKSTNNTEENGNV